MFFSFKKGIKLDLAGSLEPVLNDLQPLLEKEFKKKYNSGLKHGLIAGAAIGFILGAVLTSLAPQKPANFKI